MVCRKIWNLKKVLHKLCKTGLICKAIPYLLNSSLEVSGQWIWKRFGFNFRIHLLLFIPGFIISIHVTTSVKVVVLSAIEDLYCRWGISLNIYTFIFSSYLYCILSMLIKIMHKPEQQMNSKQTVWHLSLTAKEGPEYILYNIDLYVIIKCISVGIQSA